MTTKKVPPMLSLVEGAHSTSGRFAQQAAIPEGALTPSELLYRARKNVEHINRNGDLLVVGELFNPKPHRNGHLAFELKDDERNDESLACFMFQKSLRALSFDAAQGLRVLARGALKITPWGQVQLEVKSLELVGEGAHELAFRKLKEKLEQEGLFLPEKKRAPPFLPRSVGIVTSTMGEAIKDTLKQLSSRMPRLRIIVAPTKVQGDEAVADIADSIRRLDKSGLCDVLLVVRGGGSLQDLWAFNSEPVARAIANARTPVITGVGHEGDVTIADLVADVRASTPTHAAVLAVPVEAELRQTLLDKDARARRALEARLDRAHKNVARAQARVAHARRILDEPRKKLEQMRARLRARIDERSANERRRLHALSMRVERRAPARVLATERARLEALAARLRPPVVRARARAGQLFAVIAARLHAISPLAVLGRGYALVTRADDHSLVRRAAQVKGGDTLDVRLEEGAIKVRVEE